MERAWRALSERLAQTSDMPGTESLAQLMALGESAGACWHALIAFRDDSPICLLESPADTPWLTHLDVQKRLRSDSLTGKTERQPIPDSPDLTIVTCPLPSASVLYVAVLPAEIADHPYWQVLANTMSLLLKQETMVQRTQQAQIQSRKRLQEVAALYEMSLAVERYGIGQFLEVITERAAQVMEAQACSLLLMDPNQPVLRIGASYGLPPEVVQEVMVPIGEGIAGKVAQSGEPMMITDPALDARLRGVKANPDISSSICVPLRDRESRVFGVLTIRRLLPAEPFNEEDLRLFSVFASQIALALNNARLYSDLNRRVTELTTLADLTQIVNSTLDIDSLLALIADQLVEVARFERCALFLPVDSPRIFKPQFLRGYQPGVFSERGFKLGQGVVGAVAQKAMPLVVENAQSEIQPMRGFGRMLGANSYCALPIIVRGQCIGVIVADNRHSTQPIQAEQIELLSAFVNQAGIALENARLYREMQQRYQERESLATYLNSLLRSIGAGVFAVDREGVITLWNQVAEFITSIKPGSALGSLYSDILRANSEDSPDTYRARQAIQHVLESGTPQSLYKVRCVWGEREALTNVTVTPLRSRENQKQGAVVVFEDVREQARLEEQMSQMARLAEIGQMTATIAHEIRNPMTALKGAAQLLSQENVSESSEIYLDIIREEVSKLTQIADEFLEFARPLTLTRKTVSLGSLLQRALLSFNLFFQENRVEPELIVEVEAQVEVDPVRLEQVAHNLFQNAVQAMPDGGKLTARVGIQNDSAFFTVEDTGVGIASEQLETIFKPFFTTRVKGTGLGLSVVKKVIDAHHGAIEVESHIGHGTTFIVRLPACLASAKRAG
ncbi:MAG: GAF domain-containing protein [Fimbriimonadia bacterium]|nr:GAF domain-containing protein [Fimbriimonadia bacterium]